MSAGSSVTWACYLEITLDAAYPQSVLAQGAQVSAPRDEVHVRSGPGEPGAEVASDTARPVDSYARHSPTPSAPGLPVTADRGQ